MARGGFREGAGRVHQAPPINPLLSSLSASQSLPRLIPRKHSKHSSMSPEMVVLMRLGSLPLTPYSTEPMASQR